MIDIFTYAFMGHEALKYMHEISLKFRGLLIENLRTFYIKAVFEGADNFIDVNYK